MKPIHSLLKRQLKRHFGNASGLPPELQAFIDGVNETYHEFDADRAMLDHSLELSSEELLTANLELRAIFEVMPDPVFRLSRKGLILDIKGGSNGDWLSKRHEWIGKPLHDTPLQAVAPRFSEAIQQLATTNAPVSIEYSTLLHAQEFYYEAWLMPLVDEQIVVITRDITERKQSLRLLGAAVEQSSESIVITDTELDLPGPRILFVNSTFTKLTGYTAQEVLGKTPRILQGPKSNRAALRRLRETLRRGEMFKGETVNYRKDGTEYHVEWEIAPLRNSQGTITHFLGMQRDVTARKHSEARLEQLNKELLETSRQAGMAEMATGVLHNVGNVLNSVNTASSCVADSIRNSRSGDLTKVVALLREHEHDLGGFFTQNDRAKLVPDFLAQLAEQLARERVNAIKELASLQEKVHHIKEIVRMQQGLAGGITTKESINVVELVEDALRINSSSLARHRIEVTREFQDTSTFAVEKHKVLQILINLIRNAKQACRELALNERRMIIRTESDSGRVRIVVADNGAGILPENLSRIFTHGFTTKTDGHGFGLHSAAVAAKQSGGELRVHSNGPGQGATFTLELPCP